MNKKAKEFVENEQAHQEKAQAKKTAQKPDVYLFDIETAEGKNAVLVSAKTFGRATKAVEATYPNCFINGFTRAKRNENGSVTVDMGGEKLDII